MSHQAIVRAASHNDEMQACPFQLALSLGIPFVEVDVHLVDGALLAAHATSDINPTRTLEALYLKPLLEMLRDANGHNGTPDDAPPTGIFPSVPKQTLYLLIDVKNVPDSTFSALLLTLQPFIDENWLTVYMDGRMQHGPVTIVGTGDTPIARVVNATPRYIFYDAPFVDIDKGFDMPDGQHLDWTKEVSPVCSSRWMWKILYPSADTLREYSNRAHARGIQTRWWDVPRWPGFLRRSLWSLQLQAGVDWINADDLQDVAKFLREDDKAVIDCQSK